MVFSSFYVYIFDASLFALFLHDVKNFMAHISRSIVTFFLFFFLCWFLVLIIYCCKYKIWTKKLFRWLCSRWISFDAFSFRVRIDALSSSCFYKFNFCKFSHEEKELFFHLFTFISFFLLLLPLHWVNFFLSFILLWKKPKNMIKGKSGGKKKSYK